MSAIVVVDLDDLRAMIRAEVRAARDGAPPCTDGPAFLARRAFAERVDMAARTVDKLLARGLPHVGTGRLLRVDVRAADAWLRDNLATVGEDEPDSVTKLARKNARKGAR